MTSIRRIQIVLLSVAGALALAVVVYIARAPRPDDVASSTSTNPNGAANPPGTSALSAPPGGRGGGRGRGGAPVLDPARPGSTPAAGGSSPAPGAAVNTAVNVDLTNFLGSDRRAQLHARRMTEHEGETVLTEGVRVEAQGADKHAYIINTREARITADYQLVRASGFVAIDRDDGLSLDARWLTHDNKAGTETAGGSVRITTATRFLATDRIEYRTREDAYQLDGAVAAIDHGERGPVLAAGDHLQFNRATGVVVLSDAVQVVAGRLAIRADRLDLTLVQGQPREAVFRGLAGHEVEVEVHDPGVAGCEESLASAPLRRLRATGLRVLFEQGEARTISPLDPRSPVRIEGFDPELPHGEQRKWTLWARSLEATLAGAGKVERLAGTGIDWTSEDRTRSLEAAEMDATFDGSGSLAAALFPRGVSIAEGDRLLTGHKGKLSGGVLAVEDDPRLVAGRSHLRARKIELETATGRLHAEGNVETESPQGGHSSLPLRSAQDGDGTVRFRADRMETQGSGDVVYRGAVRAWQGSDVLQADEIRADKDLAGLTANGSVRVLLASDPARRMQASSDHLQLVGNVVNLEGGVKIEAPDAHVSSSHARLLLAEGGGPMERLEAEGDPVRVERQGVTGTARRLLHDMTLGRTDLFGDGAPVKVIDDKGQESLGDSLVMLRRGDRISLGASREAVVLSRVGPGRTP